MKVVHILQVVGLLLVVGYLFLLNTLNPQTVILPLLSPLPTALVIFLAVFIGWLAGLAAEPLAGAAAQPGQPRAAGKA